jgi:hypothetical protein
MQKETQQVPLIPFFRTKEPLLPLRGAPEGEAPDPQAPPGASGSEVLCMTQSKQQLLNYNIKYLAT